MLPENNDCYRFQDNWEFVAERATVVQRRLLRPKEEGDLGGGGGFGYKAFKPLGKFQKRLFLQETPHRKEQETVLSKISLAWNPYFVSL